jgi:signal transduction histidine kinase/ligand-binding sensor domain-containing protein
MLKTTNIYKALLFTVTFLLLTNNVFSQANYLIFNHITTTNGLSSNIVNKIYQDSDGFIWFCTLNGLNRYDSYNVVVYNHNFNDKNTIGSNNITDIIEISGNIFWVATGDSGIFEFDKFTGYFKPLHINKTINLNIRELYKDTDNTIWIATAGGGLYNYNLGDSSIIVFNTTSKGKYFHSDFIASIKKDKLNNIWIGTTTGELIRLNCKKHTVKTFKLYGSNKGLPFSAYQGYVYIDTDNNVWYCSPVGLFMYDKNTEHIKHYKAGNTEYSLSSNAVTSIIEYKKDIFFITTDHGGLNILNKKTGKINIHKSVKWDNTTINNDQLYYLYKSRDNIFWIGSYNGGVNVLNDKDKFYKQKYLLDNEQRLNCCNYTMAFCEDSKNNIWVGYDGQGVDIFDSNLILKKHLSDKTLNGNVVLTLYTDNTGDIWAGHYLKGITYYNKKAFTKIVNNSNVLKTNYFNTVSSIFQINNNEYFIGTINAGLTVYNKKNKTFREVKLPKNRDINYRVLVFYKDSEDNIWIGTHICLFKYKNNNITPYYYYLKDTIKQYKYKINAITESNNILWFATEHGLKMYDKINDNIIQYPDTLRLIEYRIKSVLPDNNNNLWMGTTNGLLKFSYNNNSLRKYEISDGLSDNSFNRNAAILTKNGKMLFGTPNGFIAFIPDSVKDNLKKPPIFITKFKIANKTVYVNGSNNILEKNICFTDTIILTWQQAKNISFEFTALSYIYPEKNRYKYMLTGVDEDWVLSEQKGKAKYTNIKPGIYIFKVKGSNNDNIWNEKTTTLVIRVIPPFWQTIWFKIIEIIAAIFMLLFIIQLRNRRLKRENDILEQKVLERTQQINEQKEELIQQNEIIEMHTKNLEHLVNERTSELKKAKEKAEESDRLKSAFLANMSHEIRTPLNAIIGFSSLLAGEDFGIDDRKRFHQIINENTEFLLRLIDDILDLSIIEANQLVINKTVFHINELMDNLYSNFSLTNKNKNVEIKLNNSVYNQHIKVYTDRLRLRQILINLMQNAIKFTKKGFIELGLFSENNNLVFYIKDTGTGISEENQILIFDRFRKLNKDGSVRGIGLGLSISKKLVDILGGNITLESELGKGSTFYLTIEKENIVTNKKISINATNKDVEFKWINKKILIAEDEPANSLFLEKLLKKSNPDVDIVRNGLEAVEKIRGGKKYDIIFMDIKMPVMDGFKALKEIKKINPKQIVIAQTAFARIEDEYEIYNAGFDQYIAKPINVDKLISILNNLL